MDHPFNPDYFSYRNEYPIEEIWNMDNALAQLIVPRLTNLVVIQLRLEIVAHTLPYMIMVFLILITPQLILMS